MTSLFSRFSSNRSRPRPLCAVGVALCALILLCVVPPPHFAFAQQSLDIERIERATVLIMQARRLGDNVLITCVSSGTLVSRDGLILTNAHSVVQGETCPGDQLLIALNTSLNAPPLPRFQADIVSADDGVDLALLRITRQNDGRVLDTASLALPFVPLGNSDSVALDDTITAVGYPGIGNDPIMAERGTIIGFATEPNVEATSWLKTSAAARGTMAGGGAYNSVGQLVGVITNAPVRRESPEAACIAIQDTNFDNAINNFDDCVLVGGAINVLRPSNFARPLLRAAALNLQVETPDVPAGAAAQEAAPSFTYLGFAPSVNPSGMPTTIIRSLPGGSNSLYLFFDYADMTPETVYELRVSIDGVPSPNFSLSPVRWSGGRQGLWYIGTSGQTLPNGVYEFALYLDGEAAGNARIVVGTAPENTPQFSDVVFGLLNTEGNPIGNGYVLPTGATASAQFLYRNMVVGQPWTYIWYYEGVEFARPDVDPTWLDTDGVEGAKTISINDANGLLPGSYRLVLYIEGRIAAVSDFTLAGAQEGGQPVIFQNQRFTIADTPALARNAAPITSFSAGVDSLYALFDWQRIAPGTLIQFRWLVDEEPFFEQTIPWNGAQNGEDFLMRLSAPGGLPDGTYRLDMAINRLRFSTAQARIGIGQLPIDRFAGVNGIQFRGQISDAVTGSGIAGASVFVISEDFSVEDFTRDWNAAQVYASATTDSTGRFEITRLLQRDAPYSLVIVAEGYLPITADGVEFTPESYPDPGNPPFEVQLAMTPG